MKKAIYYLYLAFMFTIFIPFFLLGYIPGQFIGAIYHGYKEGRAVMLSWTQKLNRWRQK